MQVHGFLKEHGVYLNYTLENLEHDTKISRQVNQSYMGENDDDTSSLTELYFGTKTPVLVPFLTP